MRKRLLILSVLLLSIIYITPVPAFVPNQPASNIASNHTEAIFNDITKDFQLFTSLLAVNPVNVRNRAEALAWLSPGFESQLAASIVDCYLQPHPDLNCMTVIATDSIPVITTADRDFCKITLLNDRTAHLDRIYSDCYNPGDRWLYQVTVEKFERWRIIDIKLNPITSTRFPSNP